jgi:hypothetical protein
LNLFDQNQPFFWTGTLLSPIDWDSLPAAIHEACLRRAGCEELHGNHLGLAGVERIAGRLITLLQRYKARFLFTRIEKRHFVSMKFVDVLLDSGLNKAVSNFHYGLRFNRLYLAHIIAALLDSDDRDEFWNIAYPSGDVRGFCRILRRLEGRIHSNIDDPRTRQLLLDAVAWGLLNPQILLEGTRSALDSPNVCALTLLIHELHRANEHGAVSVKTFVHDEQQQFGKHLRMAFDVSKRFGHADPTSPLALFINIKEMATFDCDFRTMKSKDSFGLQVLDVALWVAKKFTENPDSVQGKCRELAKFILHNGFTSEFTQESMLREVERGWNAIAALPLSADQERKGRELLQELEAIRLERMQPALRAYEGQALAE